MNLCFLTVAHRFLHHITMLKGESSEWLSNILKVTQPTNGRATTQPHKLIHRTTAGSVCITASEYFRLMASDARRVAVIEERVGEMACHKA